MTAEIVVPLHDQTSDQIFIGIKEFRQEVGYPLPQYCFKLPWPLLRHSDESPLPCREPVEEFEAVTSYFSAQIRSLFAALVTCQKRDAKVIEEHSRLFGNDGLFLTIKTEQQWISTVHLPCLHRNYHSQRLILESLNAIPHILCVRKLRLLSATDFAGDGFRNVRPISPRVPLELLTRLPSVQELECPWLWERMPVAYPTEPKRHYNRPWEGPWRDARHDFNCAAQELNDAIPASLRRARLWFFSFNDADEDQSVQMPNLVLPANVDPLSLGVSTLASHLEELELCAFLMPEVFNAQTPWPRMQRLRVEFHPLRPDGSWYFVGPRGEDPNPKGFQIHDEHYPPLTATKEDNRMDDKHNDYEEEWYDDDERWVDMFRTEPSTDRLEPLLGAFAEKLKATPSLAEAELFAYLSWFPSKERQSDYGDGVPYEEGVHKWGLKYTAAKGDSRASVEWRVGDWRPSNSIIELFEALGEGSGVNTTWKTFELTEWRTRDDPTAFV